MILPNLENRYRTTGTNRKRNVTGSHFSHLLLFLAQNTRLDCIARGSHFFPAPLDTKYNWLFLWGYSADFRNTRLHCGGTTAHEVNKNQCKYKHRQGSCMLNYKRNATGWVNNPQISLSRGNFPPTQMTLKFHADDAVSMVWLVVARLRIFARK